MNKTLSLFFTLLLLCSCDKKQEPAGSWRLNFNERPENLFFPYELNFNQDTLTIVDGCTFKQQLIYENTDDSIFLSSSTDNSRRSYSFEYMTDSILQFDGKQFTRVSDDDFYNTQAYELLGFKVETVFDPRNSSSIIHLIKEKDSTKVMLNEITAELRELPYYLQPDHHGVRDDIALYLGKGIDLEDLIETYCWLQTSSYRQVELVTSNSSFEAFYSLKDSVYIEESRFKHFLKEHNFPPVNSEYKLKKKSHSKCFSTDLDFITYLEILEHQVDCELN